MNLIENGLFGQLSHDDRTLLSKRCEATNLASGQILSTPDSSTHDVFFLTSASVALVVRNASGAGLALGLTGYEGAVGLPSALGLGAGNLTLLVQTAGSAWRMDGGELERVMARRSAMLLTFSRYLWSVAQEISTVAAFAQSQDIKARLASWLVASDLRVRQESLDLTQTHLADMLGVRRVSITIAAAQLKAQGLVEYRRGRIRIIDREGLHKVGSVHSR